MIARVLVLIALFASVAHGDELPPPLVPPPLPPKKLQVHGLFAVGPGYRSLYGIPYGVAVAEIGLGFEVKHFALYGTLIGEAGAVEPRLPLEHFRFGILTLGHFDRFRFGVGTRLGQLLVQRATTGETDYGTTIDLFALGMVDVLRWKTHAMWVGIEVGVTFDLLLGSDQGDGAIDISPFVTGLVGVRL